MGNEESEIQYGFRILKISINSPAYQAGLCPFLDFILCNPEDTAQKAKENLLRAIDINEGNEITFQIYSIITKELRNLTIKLNSKNSNQELFGAKLRYEKIADVYNTVFKILDVKQNSPFEKAEIVPQKDFILGINDSDVNNIHEFADYILENKGNELEFCLFNISDISVRYEKIVPNNKWGSKDELLGAEIGCGPNFKLPIYLIESKLNLDKNKDKDKEIVQKQEKKNNKKGNEDNIAIGISKGSDNLNENNIGLTKPISQSCDNNQNQRTNPIKMIQDIKNDISKIDEFKEIML